MATLSAPEEPEQDGMTEQELVRRLEHIHLNIPGDSDVGIAAVDAALRTAVESLGMKVLG